MKYITPWTIAGGISLIGGVIALLYPQITSLAIEQFLGWTFALSTMMGLVALVTSREGRSLWTLALTFLSAVSAYILITNPMEGILTLSLLLTAMIMISGFSQLMLAYQNRSGNGFWAFLGSGAVSILLALMLLSRFPQAGEIVLGLIFAIQLISNGFSMIAFSLSIRSIEKAPLKREN